MAPVVDTASTLVGRLVVPAQGHRLRRLIGLLDHVLAQWDAYDADQERPLAERSGAQRPLFTRESCGAARARYVAALGREAPDVPAHEWCAN